MKIFPFFNRGVYFKDVSRFLNACVVLLLIMVSTSCNKDFTKTKNDSGALSMDNKGETIMAEGGIDAFTMGAIPNDEGDDTKAIQRAIDSVAANGGGMVRIPKGKYIIDADTSIYLRDNIILKMDDETELIAKPTSSTRFYVLLLLKVKNVKIFGGKIIGERDAHHGTTGEWGMGIGIYGSDDVFIKDTHISDCWGDGITLGSKGGSRFNAPNPSTHIKIQNVLSDNNRRQGISIGEVNGVLVDHCVFTNTHGTKPQDGIDIEPDLDTAQNITIQHCEMAFNKGNGVEMYENSKSVIQNITVMHNYIHNNAYGGYLQRAANVTFTHNRIVQNKFNPPIVSRGLENSVLEPNDFQ